MTMRCVPYVGVYFVRYGGEVKFVCDISQGLPFVVGEGSTGGVMRVDERGNARIPVGPVRRNRSRERS